MAKFCTSCGADIQETYKFCPECGEEILNELSNNDDQQNGERTEDEIESGAIICDNCGEENSSENEICSDCGVLLKRRAKREITAQKKHHPSSKKINQPTNQSYRKQSKQKKKNKTGLDQGRDTPIKEFDTKKLYLILSVIAIFVLAVLYSSGVFDSDVSSTTNLNSDTDQSTRSGIDLNSLQKINELQAKVDANPNDLDLLLELAHLKNDSGFFENAIQLYQTYLDKVPENADVRIDMGVCYYNIGDFETAISEMKKALEFQPKHQIGHLNLGIVNLTAGNLEEARSWFLKAIDLGPDNNIGKRAKELLNSHNFK
jgi:tetratricopeptide (TPR) repeat protein